jgi:hypothetical protein
MKIKDMSGTKVEQSVVVDVQKMLLHTTLNTFFYFIHEKN